MNTTEMFAPTTSLFELARACPKEFKKEDYSNSWTNYATNLAIHHYPSTDWKWKTEDPATKAEQRERILIVLDSLALTDLDRKGTGGWMLSEVLEEVPERPEVEI